MARKEIIVEELLYQWHQGRNIRQIERSPGFDRKTIRKYLELAERHGLSRELPLQPYDYYLQLASALQRGLKTPVDSSLSLKKDRIIPNRYREAIGKEIHEAQTGIPDTGTGP